MTFRRRGRDRAQWPDVLRCWSRSFFDFTLCHMPSNALLYPGAGGPGDNERHGSRMSKVAPKEYAPRSASETPSAGEASQGSRRDPQPNLTLPYTQLCSTIPRLADSASNETLVELQSLTTVVRGRGVLQLLGFNRFGQISKRSERERNCSGFLCCRDSVLHRGAKTWQARTRQSQNRQRTGSTFRLRLCRDACEMLRFGLAEFGIKPGDRIALLLRKTDLNGRIADLAILSLGAMQRSGFIQLTPSIEIRYILTDSGARAIFVSNKKPLGTPRRR